MAGSINKVILVGNLGADPEVRATQNGSEVCNLRIATSESWKDRSTGERREKTEWHRVVIFNDNLTRIAKEYLRKGSKVYIEGQLQTRKWQDQSGQDRYSTEVVLQGFRGAIDTILSAVFLVAVDSVDGWFEGNLPNHAAAARAIEEGDAEKARNAMEQVLGFTQSKLSQQNADAGRRNGRFSVSCDQRQT